MTDQMRQYLNAIIHHLEHEGDLEVNDGNVRVSNGQSISLGLVSSLLSGGWLLSQSPEPFPKEGRAGYGSKLIITSPGPAWWSEKEAQNARFLAHEMKNLAEANMSLQIALDESAGKFNRSMRVIAVSALVIALATLVSSVIPVGVALNWW